MSLLDFLMGSGGGSMMDNAKQGSQQMSILQMLGLDGGGDQRYTAPIGPTQNGMPMPSSVLDPALVAQKRSSTMADLGKNLSAYGAGVSQASGPSRMPVDFGQAMAGGQAAMQAGDDRDLQKRLTEAQIGKAQADSVPDLEKSAQAALVKANMGLPLTPQEQASLQSFDTINQAKIVQDRFGNQGPATRSIMPPNVGGTPTGGQAPDLQSLRGYHQYLKQKAGMQ